MRAETHFFALCQPRIIVASARNAHNFPRRWIIRRSERVTTATSMRRRRFVIRTKGKVRDALTSARAALLLGAALVLCAGAFAQSDPPAAATTAKPAAPAALPSDQHNGITISVDPYTDSARSKEKFGKASPNEVGVLPVEVFLRNDSAQPIRVNLETVQLEVNLRSGVRQEVDWLRPEEVAKLIAHPGGAANPQQKRLPLPIPIPIGDKKAEKFVVILRPLTLDADVIPPKATVHGFLYFDVSNEMSLADRASLYLPDVSLAISNEPLVYFEVPLRQAAKKP